MDRAAQLADPARRAARRSPNAFVLLALAAFGCDGCGCDGSVAEADVPADVSLEADAEGAVDGIDADGDDPDVVPDGRDGATDDGPGDVAEDAPTDVPLPADTCFGPTVAAVDNAGVPAGFCAWTWAADLSAPRGIEVASNGDVLVVERGGSRITVLFDSDGDGVSGPGERAPLASASGLNHGIAIHEGSLYASSAATVFRWPYAPGDRADLGSPETVVRDIPSGGH